MCDPMYNLQHVLLDYVVCVCVCLIHKNVFTPHDDYEAFMTIGFILDHPEAIQEEYDTSLSIIHSLRTRHNCEVWVTHADDLYLRDNTLHSRWRLCTYSHGRPYAESLVNAWDAPADGTLRAMVMRKDPPVDAFYIQTLQLLQHTQVPVLNSPAALMRYNEKLLPLYGPFAVPDTVVSSSYDRVWDYHKHIRSRWVMKSLVDCGGNRVFLLEPSATELEVQQYFQQCSSNSTSEVMMQPFIPEVRLGDKRIFMLHGKILGWVLRVPQRGNFKANLHQGATPAPFKLSAQDRSICAWVASFLPPDEVPMVAVDIIHGFLTEVNITSPSGVLEIQKVSGVSVQDHVADYLMQI